MMDSPAYYKNKAVRARMLEYCGVSKEKIRDTKKPLTEDILVKLTDEMSAYYLVGWGGKLLNERKRAFESVSNYSLEWLLDCGLDVFRSMWDNKSTLGVIDVEYFSFRDKGRVYRDQSGIFWLLEPAYQCIKETLNEYGIKPLTLATGQGYHIVFKVSQDNPVHKSLEEIGCVDDTLMNKYGHVHPGSKKWRRVADNEALGFDGMGRLIEFITHKVMLASEKWKIELPIVIGDAITGNHLKDGINFDLSAFTCPIYMRDIRLPFSTHHKHKVYPGKIGVDTAVMTPIQIAIPRYTPFNGNELKLSELFDNRRHFRNSANYAEAIETEIPDESEGVARLIENYKKSKLYEFHKDFDKTKQDEHWDWYKTYDAFDLRSVPQCVAGALANPAPAMLEPAQIQTLVRVLTGRQWWHPKHVAGLLRSKYERGYDWADCETDFKKYDANAMANAFVRFYAGLLATGIDKREDQNCISHQEKGLCPGAFCGRSLGDFA